MAILAKTLVAFLAYLVSLAIYRLYFSPLARFPGPKLAALSRWYEMYYDVIKGGKYFFRIDEMHAKYGPIVRVAPFELHIKDSSFYYPLYVQHPDADKSATFSQRFGNERATFTTASAKVHAMRRGALNNMFSRRAILNVGDVVAEKVEHFSDRLERYIASGEVLNIADAFAAWSGDIISQYSFGFSYSHLDSKGFQVNFEPPFKALNKFAHVVSQFPWMTPLLDSLPEKWLAAMNPDMQQLFRLKLDVRKEIQQIRSDQKKGLVQPDHPTIAHTLLQSSLADVEKSDDRIGDEAVTLLAAGTSTTTWALSVGMYYLLADGAVLQRLRSELDAAIPTPSDAAPFQLQQLEKLPYLTACVREALRISTGVPARSARVLSEPLHYGDWTIPPGMPVSMSIMDVLLDEKIFPDPHAFKPERWLGNPRAPDGKPLEHYFIAFSKGPRSCLAPNLAYLEMYVGLALVLRRFHLELYETDVTDVAVQHEFLVAAPRLDSKGIRARVLGMRK